MHVPQSSENLATAWAEAVAAAVFAPLAVATEATAAAASLWTATRPKPAETSAGPYERQSPSARSIAAEKPREPSPPAAEKAPRSWYRAPYRSAFDPMFWLQPGHPVDHLPETVGSAMQLGMLGNWAGSSTWPAPAMTGLFPALFAGQSAPWNPTPSNSAPWNPISWNPWAFAMPAATAWDVPKLPPNVIDFNSAYAAYRTAGGHAAAQILHGTMAAAQTAPPPRQDAQSALLGWPLNLMMMPWMSSYGR